ncbi:hypothetical protein V6N12_054368 [Hibiscus sabdariffa]|uniref:Uncharacterized protein n=1 Tax=Hibiscus sabdariffa TaxID=183260 RepID=A0ABR2D116_9ROSI
MMNFGQQHHAKYLPNMSINKFSEPPLLFPLSSFLISDLKLRPIFSSGSFPRWILSDRYMKFPDDPRLDFTIINSVFDQILSVIHIKRMDLF